MPGFNHGPIAVDGEVFADLDPDDQLNGDRAVAFPHPHDHAEQPSSGNQAFWGSSTCYTDKPKRGGSHAPSVWKVRTVHGLDSRIASGAGLGLSIVAIRYAVGRCAALNSKGGSASFGVGLPP